jgi:hypothetical protein
VNVTECFFGVLWNLAAGNGLVQNGYVGLISCATAGTSISLSAWCCFYSFDKLNLENDRSQIEQKIRAYQYWIVAPILAGIICTLGSVLGAAYLFHKSGEAESHADRSTEKAEFIAGQLYPAAVNFILVARYLAQLAYVMFLLHKQETLICVEVVTAIRKADQMKSSFMDFDDSDGQTPLSRAAQKGDEAAVRKLLEQGRTQIPRMRMVGRRYRGRLRTGTKRLWGCCLRTGLIWILRTKKVGRRCRWPRRTGMRQW